MYMTIMDIITRLMAGMVTIIPRVVDTVITTMVAYTIVTTINRTHSPFSTLFLTYPVFWAEPVDCWVAAAVVPAGCWVEDFR
jgi:hypothetical protein